MTSSAFSYAKSAVEILPQFGDPTPFAEPLWYQGYPSPYYTPAHARWRAKCRTFVDEHLLPHIEDWEQAGAYPKDLFKQMYEHGLFGACFPVEYGGTPFVDEGKAQYDIFFELIWLDELARCGANGITLSVNIVTMGLPPVLTDGPPAMKDRVCKPVVTGEKQIALCITEAGAGSDVAQIGTTAERFRRSGSEEECYRISGQKKWISCGLYADYFTVACKTRSPDKKNGISAQQSVSLILVERDRPGVSVRKMHLQGCLSGGTAVVTFDKVEVPVTNLIGKEHAGFPVIMKNFNHERFVIAACAVRSARLCLEEALKRGMKRETFGVKLGRHQALRHRLMIMAAKIESVQSLLEFTAFQLQSEKLSSSGNGGADKMGRLIALLKYQSTQTWKHCALEAAQVFGGLAYTRDGVGGVVERSVREMLSAAIPGGSEEIMLELAMKLSKL